MVVKRVNVSVVVNVSEMLIIILIWFNQIIFNKHQLPSAAVDAWFITYHAAKKEHLKMVYRVILPFCNIVKKEYSFFTDGKLLKTKHAIPINL